MSEYTRMRWLCRRGMKELDELLTRFVERDFEHAPAPVQAAFAALLEYSDPELYALLCGRAAPCDPEQADVIVRIRHAADA
ncbi:MAG: succinate dehydrogenase assembly factor 2 [Halofilum sp. (in: g-proteobacteria)]